MRVLLTGARGQLGHDLARALADDELLALPRSALDVTDEPAVWAVLRDYAPEVVVNAAAVTTAGEGAADPEPAWDVNVGGAANLARACDAAGVWLVHMSCGYVFDGALGRPYTEFDRVAACTELGRTKEAGEQLVRQFCPDHQIIRTGWLQGAHRESFVSSIVEWGRRAGRVEVADGQFGNPTFAADLAPAIRQLAATRRAGTYHVTNSGASTWQELAVETFRMARMRVRVEATGRSPVGTPHQPRDNRLEGRNTRLAGLSPLPHWREGLARLLASLGE